MHVHQQKELWILGGLLIGAAVIGAIFDYTMLFFVIALSGYALYSLYNTFKLHNWLLNHSNQSPPEARGLWGELFYQLYLMNKETGSKRAHISNILKRFQEAAAALPDSMIILTKRNKIEWSNNAAHRLLGIDNIEDIGQQISNLIRHPKFEKYLKKNDFSKSIVLPSPVKPETVFSLQVIPFGSSQKLIICRDVSHVAKLEAMRSSFVANVSHELRTPITVLSGYLETLLGMKLDSENTEVVKRTFTTMQEQAKRMERLVADLLVLSKLETQPVDHLNKKIDIEKILESLTQSAVLLSDDAHHNIKLNIEKGIFILGNHDELQSLFSNLINNAIQYTPAGGNIDIYWRSNDSGAEFVVKDTGHGIAPQHIPHLTERFYRVDVDRSRETGGTGLGLAIVKHIVERHDGQLSIVSELDHGSAFSCQFPSDRVVFTDK